MRLGLAALLLLGCNDILGFGDPTLAVTNPSTPSCDTGWTHRAPITLTNESESELDDYQVKLTIDTKTLISAGELQATGDDLRFTTGSGNGPLAQAIETGLDTMATTVWIDVPVIPLGTSTIYLYYGNPAAEAVTLSPFVQGIITNASFEDFGGWTMEQVLNGTSDLEPKWCNRWSSDGACSLFIDQEVNGERSGDAHLSIGQPTVFPAGTDYVIRVDINVIAASNSGSNWSNDAGFYMTLGDGLTYIWELNARQNITGVHLGEESHSFGPGSVPLTLGASVVAGTGPGYAKGYIDNLRVRKSASPEPTAQLGSEEACRP